jgi:hypothetical protein
MKLKKVRILTSKKEALKYMRGKKSNIEGIPA